MTSGHEKEALAKDVYAFPLSFAQQRLWYLQQLAPASAAYNIPLAYRLNGLLNVAALEQSLSSLVRRHEILRTTFSLRAGEPVQVVHPDSPLSLSMTDLRPFQEREREETLQRLLLEDARRPFELDHGPLLRAGLIQTKDDEHIFYLNMHHIISDEWSVRILFQELALYYAAHSDNAVASLPELPIQYADYSGWQRGWLQGQNFADQLSYWRKQLDGVSTVELPIDRPRPTVQTYCGGEHAISISPTVCHQLKNLSRQEGVTFFMTLLAAFQIFLHRYTGHDDVPVGTPIAGRTRYETEGLIGFFVNTLVLRPDITGNPTVKEFLARVGQVALDAYDHQDLPFERLVQELNPERDLSRNPVFQIIFAFRNSSDSVLVLPNIYVSRVSIPSEVAKFDLGSTVTESKDFLQISFTYNTDLFNADTIERMVGHFGRLLEGVAANPEQRLSELPLLSEPERHQLLVDFNDTKTDYPKDKCIQELFEAQVEKTPDAIALVFEEQQLTYRELDNRANQLAHCLVKLGIGPEALVGICMERSMEMVVGILGILKAGGVYVPLDPSYPGERLGFMLEDTRASIVVTDLVSRNSLPPNSPRVICLDQDWEEIAREPQVNPGNKRTADNLAYVIYTSGSTGVPKGVEVRHRGVVRLLFGVDYVRLDRAQTFLHLAPISFDAATFELWGALLHGGKCVLFPGKMPSAEELGEVLKKHRVNALWLTAALFNTVINEEPQALSEVKQLLIGGEALSVPHVKKGLAELPNTEVINGYGPTESTTFTCCYRIPRQLDDNLTSIPIGKPIGNTQVYILDPHLNPVPIGIAGEIYIGGDGVARGYLNRPELTAEKFISNPFSDEPEARLYKTGDRARYLPDGNIEFLGRIDHQVKIRGYRIELGEIETVLGQHSSLRETVVLAREDGRGDRRLVAYAVVAAGFTPSVNELRSFLQQKLPEYMVPSVFVFLDSLPLTPNGKLDRKALPAPDQTRPELAEAYSAPRTPVEELLAQIWSDVLQLDQVGIHDNFFELGGHSLLATQMISRIRDTFKIDFPLRSLFEAPTIYGLAQRVQELGEKQDVMWETKITPVAREQYRVQQKK